MIIFICWLVIINAIVLVLHKSTDLFAFGAINGFIKNAKLQNTIYVDVYSEANDNETGRDNRLAIVKPFNWYLLNSRANVYALSSNDDYGGKLCDGNNVNGFLKLKSPLSGHSLQNVYRVCLPVTISVMVTHFANKPKTKLYYNDQGKGIDIIDIVDFLLLKGAFTNCIM
jgi:Baculovirus 19 kDa protein conserved region